METKEILTQEEIDALLSGVEAGAVAVSKGGSKDSPAAVRVDFSNQNQLLNTGIPILNVAYERFSLNFCESIFNALRCSNTVEFTGTRMISFVDYLNSMELPTFINFINLPPMRGLAIAVFDADLICTAVDRFFGGALNQEINSTKRSFTPAEFRMGNMLLQRAFIDLKNAWQALLPIEPELVQTEINPDFAHLLNPSEPLMLNTFDISLNGSEGKFQLAIPHTMIEPFRDRLISTYRSDATEISGAWTPVIMEEMKSATVRARSVLGRAQLTVREILDLCPGDVIALDVPEKITLYAEDIPIFKGDFGAYNGKNAIKITGKVARP